MRSSLPRVTQPSTGWPTRVVPAITRQRGTDAEAGVDAGADAGADAEADADAGADAEVDADAEGAGAEAGTGSWVYPAPPR